MLKVWATIVAILIIDKVVSAVHGSGIVNGPLISGSCTVMEAWFGCARRRRDVPIINDVIDLNRQIEALTKAVRMRLVPLLTRNRLVMASILMKRQLMRRDRGR